MTDIDADLSAYQRKRKLAIAGLIAVTTAILLVGGSSQSELSHEQIEFGGMMLILIGIGGRMWSTLYIGGHKSSAIINTGPYSIMRNPLYFFSMIAAAGVGAQTGSIAAALFFAFMCWAAFMIVIRREEAFLSARFGQPYLDYLASTPRFFPNPRLYKDNEEVTFRPRMLGQTCLDGLVFFGAVPLFEFIEALQEQAVLPVLFYIF